MARFRLDTQWRCLLLCSILIMPVTTFAQRPSLTGINSRVLTLEEQDRSEGTQLVIESAVIAGTAIEIRGVNFDTGGEPEVLLGGLPVSVTSFGPYDVQVSLDAPLVAGSYALTVQTGPSRSQFDAFTITMGSTGPQGEPGPIGPRGFQGPAGIAGLRVLRTSTTVGPSSVGKRVTSCASNEIAINGGFTFLAHDTSGFPAQNFFRRSQIPSNGPGSSANRWVTIIANTTSETLAGEYYVVCARAAS